jgi:hypothetical protein
MTPQEFSSKIKAKYPQYAKMDDNDLTQRMVKKYPQYASQIDQPMDWKGVVGSAVKSAGMMPGTIPNKLMVPSLANAPDQAKALPPLASAVGGIMGGPMGMTKFGEPARALSDMALASYGMKDKIPSPMAHLGELGGNLLGDVIALPAIKKKIYGSQIGKVEKMAGVPPPQDIRSLPRPGGTQSVSTTIDEAVDSVKGSEMRGTPTFWKQIKDQVDWIYERGKSEALSKGDKAKLAWLNGQVQKGLNISIPGRAGPAAALAESQVVPNAIGRSVRMLPPKFRAGLGYGAGFGAPVVAIEELVRRLLSK